MEEMLKNDTKIIVGDLVLWTRPWCENKAMITTNEGGASRWLFKCHAEHPELFEILQDDEDFCEEDLDGGFSVIVDPDKTQLMIVPGYGTIGFNSICELEDDESEEDSDEQD